MLELLRSLVFPRACLGCDADGAVLCPVCATSTGPPVRDRLAGLDVFACGAYSGVLRAAIMELKGGRRAVASDLAALVAPYVDAGMTLVPVPTTRRRRAERGFDQSALLARLLHRRTGCAVAPLLVRAGGDTQRGRSRAQRLESTGRFRLRRGASASAGDLVLFDDVCTTGSSLVDAAHTLESHGFVPAGAIVIARAKETPS